MTLRDIEIRLDSQSIDDLLATYLEHAPEFVRLEALLARVKHRIQLHLEADGATEMVHSGFEEIKLVYRSPDYDQSILETLGEIIEPQALDNCWIPPKPQQGKYSMVKLLPLAKRRGKAAMEIVERAQQPTDRPRLSIKTA